MKKRTFLIISIALFVVALTFSKVFYFPHVVIPTTAMENTLKVDEIYLVNRLFKTPERNDILAYYYPEGDSMIIDMPTTSYYTYNRMRNKKQWIDKNKVKYVPLKERLLLFSRCVGMPGDILEIKNGVVFCNKKPEWNNPLQKMPYFVVKEGIINPKLLDTLGISKDQQLYASQYDPLFLKFTKFSKKTFDIDNIYFYRLEKQTVNKLKNFSVVKEVLPIIKPKEFFEKYIFPFSEKYPWNEDNFGPILIPKKGKTLKLNLSILPIYKKIITDYENKKLEIKNGYIYINGNLTEYYQFEKNYYFVMGDNRYASLDSRYWGFLPYDYIFGKLIIL